MPYSPDIPPDNVTLTLTREQYRRLRKHLSNALRLIDGLPPEGYDGESLVPYYDEVQRDLQYISD